MNQNNKRNKALKNALQMLACGAMLSLPLSANTLLDTYPDWTGVTTNGYLEAAQTFLVGSDTILSNFQFKMFSAPGQSVHLQIFAWNVNGPTGPVLYTSPTYARLNATQDFLVTNINLALTQGSLYGAVVDNFGYAGQNSAFNLNQASYTGGNLWLVNQSTPNTWNNFAANGYNLTFQAAFLSPGTSGVPEPASFLFLGVGLITLAAFRRLNPRHGDR